MGQFLPKLWPSSSAAAQEQSSDNSETEENGPPANGKRRTATKRKRNTKQSVVNKKQRTSDYIYQTLFVSGEQSDVSICAFGKEWKLHKIYLQQSLYFKGMFSGAWQETKQNKIELVIPDENITLESFETVLSALYRDDISIGTHKEQLIALLATANWLQVESVISHCCKAMTSNLSELSVVQFVNAAEHYDQTQLLHCCLEWLIHNLMHFSHCLPLLRSIDLVLMQKLVSSSDLFVLDGEMDLYSLLLKWTCIKLDSRCSGSQTEIDAFLKRFNGKSKSFLETCEGADFVCVFKELRIGHVVTSLKTINALQSHNLIPANIINTAKCCLWEKLLCAENNAQLCCTISDDSFYSQAMRCGRVLQTDTPYCWRWSGYNFGFDVLLTYKYRTLCLKRNCSTQPGPQSVNLKAEKEIFYRLTLVSFDENRRVSWSRKTDLLSAVLAPDQTHILARIPSQVKFPLTVILNYLTDPFLPLDNRVKNIWNQIEAQLENEC